MRLPRLLRAAETDECLAACIFSGEAAAHAVVDMQRDVRLEFRGKVFVRAAAKDSAKPRGRRLGSCAS